MQISDILHHQPVSKYILIFLSCLLFKVSCSQTIPVKEYDNCKLYISSAVSYRDMLYNSLLQDTLVICYFKEKIKEPVSVYINQIEIDGLNPNAYLVTIFISPLAETEIDRIKRILSGAARSKYRIDTIIDVNPLRKRITGIHITGHDIQM